MRPVTLKDLARELGLSKSTVSRALRNHPHVREETRRAVQALAAARHYYPDRVAQSLVERRSRTLGLVIPRIEFPYFAQAIGGIEEVITQAGYTLTICQSHESYTTEQQVVQTLVASHVDGLLISLSAETVDLAHLHAWRERGLPVVLFDRVADTGDLPRVEMDNEQAAYLATAHLLAQGYRRLAHIGGPPALRVSQQRAAGFRRALREEGGELDPSLCLSLGFRQAHGEAGAAALLALPQPPDAIVAVSDSVAIGAKLALERAGRLVPTEVGLVGFNDEPLAALVHPALTTVALPMREMGIRAARLLLQEILHPEPTPRYYRLAPRLVVRESSLKPLGTNPALTV